MGANDHTRIHHGATALRFEKYILNGWPMGWMFALGGDAEGEGV